MSESDCLVDKILIGDHVAYKLSAGDPEHEVRGKVLGLVSIRDGHTLADVAWDTFGPPKRLNITHLTKV
jgi:hypothetical protein